MINSELTKRVLTSIFLITLLVIVFLYSFMLIITLIITSLIAWLEFNGLIFKIYEKNYLRLSFKAISLIYLTFFSVITFQSIELGFKTNIIYIVSICIVSDIGGLLFGKIFKGKKLTKISPNKTISGSIGSFILSLVSVPIFYYFLASFYIYSLNLFNLVILSLLVSMTCQLGDLFISYLKRKANVKDTGDLLPGHGGVLDRIDGILFALPMGILLWDLLFIS